MSHPPKVLWFPSECGVEFGIEEGTPLWEGLIAPRLAAEAFNAPPVEVKPAPRKSNARVGDELTPKMRAARVAALTEFYGEFGEHELPYEGGECLDPPAEEVGPDKAPPPRGDREPQRFSDPS